MWALCQATIAHLQGHALSINLLSPARAQTRQAAPASPNASHVCPIPRNLKASPAPAYLTVGAELDWAMPRASIEHIARGLSARIKPQAFAQAKESRSASEHAHMMLRRVVQNHDALTPAACGFAALMRERQLLQRMDLQALRQRLGHIPSTPMLAANTAPTPTLLPIGPPRAVTCGQVTRLQSRARAATHNGPREQESHLLTTDAGYYIVGPTLAAGQAKRFSFGIDNNGQPVGVWRFRPHVAMPHVQVELSNLMRLSQAFDVFDVIRTPGHTYAMVTLMPGGNAMEALGRASLHTGPVIVHHIMAQSARQLGQLHAQGFVHRDVKPANMLCDAWGQVALCDFDWAQPLHADARATKQICGTYIAPESWERKALSTQSDTWSWAAGLGDLYVGAACNPHNYVARDAGSDKSACIDVRASHKQNQSFVRWRKRLFDDAGRFDASRIIDDGSIWGRYYSRLRQCDPAVTSLALAYGLEADPARRVSMQTLSDVCDLLVQADSRHNLDGAALLRQASVKTHITLWAERLGEIDRALKESSATMQLSLARTRRYSAPSKRP